MSGPRVALVHDYLVVRGGAERTLLSLARLYPSAPIYTAVYRPRTTLPEFAGLDVRPLWPSRIPAGRSTYRALVATYALAFEGLRLQGYDLALSNSSGFAKSAGAGARRRVAICQTPPRFLWDFGPGSVPGGGAESAGRALLGPWLRRLDLAAARRVDLFAANSENVRARIRRVYDRDAEVVYAPVDTDRFQPGDGARAGYLLVGRLVRYKRFDAVIAACAGSGRRLTVAGAGPDEGRLRSLAGASVDFAGEVPNAHLADLYSRARALILPGEEDLGLTPLEANACGCPVVAAAGGGALETVLDGVTGVLYDPGRPDGLEAALLRLEAGRFPPERLREHALRFSEPVFHQRVAALVERALG